MSNVVALHEKSGDNRRWSVEQMLEETLRKIRSGEIEATAAIVVLVDTNDGSYDNQFTAANLSATESIALLEIQKMDIMSAMGRR